jgi:hypothetical protein
MSFPQALMDRTNNVISVLELKRLLIDLKEKRPGVCVRFRLMGELWAKNFMFIAGITDKGVLLKDDSNNNFTAISNLADIMQFEIDEPFQGFRPYNHYDIILSQEF